MKIQLKEGHAPTARTLEAKMCLQDVDVSQRNTVLNRNSRLLLWWSQQKKDVNDVNLQFDNSQSGHGPLDPPLLLLLLLPCYLVTLAQTVWLYRGSKI